MRCWFSHDGRWAESAWSRDRFAPRISKLPHGLADHVDHALRLNGKLSQFVESHPSTVEPVANVDESHLRPTVRAHYPEDHYYLWHEQCSYGIFVSVIIDQRQ